MHGQALHKLVVGLVRRTWIFALMATLACAAFAASAVAALVEASYLAPSAEAASLPAAPKPQTTPAKTTPDGSALVSRNIFCSSCTPSVEVTGPADFFVPQAILIATSVGLDPRATIRVPASEAQGSYGLGDAIPGVGKVDRIGWRSVDVLDAGGRRGRLDLLGQTGGAAVSGGAATPDTTAAADPILSRIKKIDDHTFEVDRDLVRDLVSGTVKPGGMRILPLSGKDGKLEGLRVFGVKDTALAGLVGLKNGDIMTAINNTPIKNAQSLLDVYAQLDTLNTVEIDGKRGDKPLALTLRLR
jgi:hypothetical protein